MRLLKWLFIGLASIFWLCLNMTGAAAVGLHDMVEMTVLGNPGTGTFQLGVAIPPYLPIAAVASGGETVSYHAQDVAGDWENGRGVWTPGSGGGSLTRGVVNSSNSNALVNFGSGSTTVFLTALAADMVSTQYPNPALLSQYAQPPCPLTDAATIVSSAVKCANDPTKGVGTNTLTLTGAGHTLAIPPDLPASGGQDVMYWITHSGNDGPTLGTGFLVPGGGQPPECSGTITTGCWSTTAGVEDWLPCRSKNASLLGCGPVLTNMAPAVVHFVQGSLGTYAGGSGTSINAAGPVVGAGDMVVGAVFYANTGSDPITTCTDDKGNNYPLLTHVHDVGPSHWFTTFSLYNITNGPSTPACNFSSGVTERQIMWLEYAGLGAGPVGGATGQAQVGPGTSADAITSTSATGSALAVGFGMNFVGYATEVVGTGYTQRLHDTSGSALGFIAEDKRGSGSLAATLTESTNDPSNTYLTAVVMLHP